MLCAAAVNPAVFMTDHQQAISVRKEHSPSPGANGGSKGEKRRSESSISLVWVVTGVPNLTKVCVYDVCVGGLCECGVWAVCVSVVCGWCV